MAKSITTDLYTVAIEKAWELIDEKFIQTQDFHPFVEGQGSLAFPII